MRGKLVPITILAVVVAGLLASVGWAVGSGPGNWMGGGKMHRGAYSMMGQGGTASPWYLDGSGPVTTIAGARAQAQKFADRLGLKTAEVMQFDNNFYVRLDDAAGKGATEVLVDPQSGSVTIEYGPAMMWNTQYGMHAAMGSARGDGAGMMGGSTNSGMIGSGSGMMGGGNGPGMMGNGNGMMGTQGGSPMWTPADVVGPVSATQARQLANRWLAAQGTGATAWVPDAMPGYYTMETSKSGKIDGMVSVNEQTGAVWYHWWHGRFVAMEE